MMGISEQHLRELIIQPALDHLDLYSEAAENLLVGTCKHESHAGRYLKQIQGPALGIYQIEPATHQDIWSHFLAYRDDLAHKVGVLVSVKTAQAGIYTEPADHITPSHHNELITNLLYATAIARLVYYRRPEPLPDAHDVPALAQYWKDHYNTHKGAGSPGDFIDAYFM